MKDKSLFITFLRTIGKSLPGDYAKTFFYLNCIKAPRKFFRLALNSFYRMEHVYDILRDFKKIEGKFSILEFGVAGGVSFTKHLFATKYTGLDDRVKVYGFDTFEGMPAEVDDRNKDVVGNDDWIAGQFNSSYEELNLYCKFKYSNFELFKGLFKDTLTPEVLNNFNIYQPILIWIDCDFYTSAKTVFEKLLTLIPNGCIIYFDELDNINFGSRFTGEARLVYEINTGKFGEGMELILDTELSLNSKRIYRFLNFQNPVRYKGLIDISPPDELFKRTNDSPLP
jgi:Macrocin-O-methyltransferase (TylF)